MEANFLVLVILAIGSAIGTVVASLKCVKSCSSCFFKIETIQSDQPDVMAAQPVIKRTDLMNYLVQKITPRVKQNTSPTSQATGLAAPPVAILMGQDAEADPPPHSSVSV